MTDQHTSCPALRPGTYGCGVQPARCVLMPGHEGLHKDGSSAWENIAQHAPSTGHPQERVGEPEDIEGHYPHAFVFVRGPLCDVCMHPADRPWHNVAPQERGGGGVDLEAIRNRWASSAPYVASLCDEIESLRQQLTAARAERSIAAGTTAMEAPLRAVDLDAIRRRHPRAFDDRWALIPGSPNSDIHQLTAEVESLKQQIAAGRQTQASLLSNMESYALEIRGLQIQLIAAQAERDEFKQGLEVAEFEQGFANVWRENERLRAQVDWLKQEHADMHPACSAEPGHCPHEAQVEAMRERCTCRAAS